MSEEVQQVNDDNITRKKIRIKTTKVDDDLCNSVLSVKQIITDAKVKAKEKQAMIEYYTKIIHRSKSIISLQQDLNNMTSERG